MQWRIKRFFTLFLVLALGAVFLAACDAADDETPEPLGEEDTGIVDDEDIVEDETPVVDEEPIEEETPVVDEEPVEEETPVADEDVLEDEVLAEDAQLAPGLITADTLIGLEVVSETDEEIAEVTDALFDINGNIHYVIVDIEEEPEVAEEEIDTVAVSWDLLQGPTDDAAEEADEADVGLQGPLRLVFLGDLVQLQAEPAVDVAVLEESEPFVDPNNLGLTLPQEIDFLIQVGEFEDFDLTDHDLVNAAGEELGDIDELVIDVNNGRVAYVIADVGGFLGIGENDVAIPWDKIRYETEDEDFVVDADNEAFEAAPTVDLDEGLFDVTAIDDFWDEEIPDAEDVEDAEDEATTEEPVASGLVTSDTFIGLEIVNEAEETLAVVTDGLFDVQGNIQFVVVDVAEELGTLDEGVNAAVSWDLVEMQADTVTEETAEADIEPSFRLVYLPDDAGLLDEPQVEVALLEEAEPITSAEALGLVEAEETPIFIQVSEFENFDLSDHDIITADGEELGDIDELLIDLSQGRVAYIVMDVGGFLGIDERSVAIPMTQLLYDDADEDFVADVTAEELEAAPTVDDETIENDILDTDLEEEIESFWGDETDPDS